MRYIQIFISSTFGDMHRERDLLHQIAGLINRDIFDQGYQVILRDLRYGIDTAGMDDEVRVEKKVLGECFETINQCQLFVLLLGDRYGSVFEDLSVPQLYMPGRELEGKSVTHLEIEYGMLKIDRNYIIVFERTFSGDPSILPPQYQENETGIAKNKKLKESLNCYFDTYSAKVENGKFVIDEYYFLKHGQAFIQQAVSNYILQANQSGSEDAPKTETGFSEALSDVLWRAIDKKTAKFSDNYMETARELILFRIQDLLSQQDYDRINQLGSGGDVILEYRRSLIDKLPEDFIGLLREICNCISTVVDPDLDVFSLLQAIAAAQNTELRQMGGISLREIMSLVNREEFPAEQTYNGWLNFRHEISGANYHHYRFVQRALACFSGSDVLLTGSTFGYLLKDVCIAELLQKSAPAEYQEKIWTYIAHNFWYLPDPIHAWLAFLKINRFDFGLLCLETVGMDHRFTDLLLQCVEKTLTAEQTIALLGKFIDWMIEHNVEEAYILYTLGLCRQIADCDEDSRAEKQYEMWIVPLYQRACRQYLTKHPHNLTAAGLFLLWHIDNEVWLETCKLPTLPALTTYNECADDLTTAVFNLFYRHDLSQPEELKEYLRMVNVLTQYLDQFICLLRAATVHTQVYWDILCENLLLMAFGNEVLESDSLIHILASVMHIHCNADSRLTAIEALNNNLMEYAYCRENYELCISVLQIVNDIASTETKLRRTKWHRWSTIISCDVVDKLFQLTNDAAVRKIAILQENLMFVEPEKLDEAFLREVEEYRRG